MARIQRRPIPAPDHRRPQRLRGSGLLSWLGIVLVAFNLLAGSLLPSAAADAAMVSASERLVVCTATGMQVLGDDADATLPPDHQRQPLCAFCLPLLHGGGVVAAADAVVVAQPHPGLPPTYPHANERPPAAGLAVATAPRAPPIV